jgi:diacylglycerol kinase
MMDEKDHMRHEPPTPVRSWAEKFRDSFRGLKAGIRSQSSFFVHFFFTAVVLTAAAILKVHRNQWCVLILCITIVLTAEMFNSALESMARAITGESNPHLGNALDIAAAAVLVASVGATIVGVIVFAHQMAMMLGWLQPGPLG